MQRTVEKLKIKLYKKYLFKKQEKLLGAGSIEVQGKFAVWSTKYLLHCFPTCLVKNNSDTIEKGKSEIVSNCCHFMTN